MKKAINITIGNCVFYIEEDAYTALHDYLESVKAYFASAPDANEIVEDMEARMAEHFQKHTTNQAQVQPIITRTDVANLIAVMGNVEDFSDANTTDETAGSAASGNATTKTPRRLMRDPDNKILFGVCSGLGAYFNTDPLFVRLAFVIATLLWGWGLILYIILWLITPEASSPADKMEMRGRPITLAAVKEEIQEVAERHQKEASALTSAIKKLFEVLGNILTFIFKKLIPALVRLVGAIIVAATGVGLLVLTAMLATAAFNFNSPYIDIPLGEILGTGLYYGLLFSYFFAILIPVLAIFFLALTVARMKVTLPKTAGITLFGVWVVAISIAGALTVHAAPRIQSAIETNPSFIEVERAYPLENFSSITTSDTIRATVTLGDTFAVSAVGTENSLENLVATVQNGTLELREKPRLRACVVCLLPQRSATLAITMPSIDTLTAEDASRITTGVISGDTLTIITSDIARIESEITATEGITVSASDASRVTLSGETPSLETIVNGISRVDAAELPSQTVRVSARDASRAEVYALETLSVTARDISKIFYGGSPSVESTLSDMAHVSRSQSSFPDN